MRLCLESPRDTVNSINVGLSRPILEENHICNLTFECPQSDLYMLRSETFSKDVVSLKSDTQLIFKRHQQCKTVITKCTSTIGTLSNQERMKKSKRNKGEAGEKKNAEQKGRLNLGARSL